MSILPHDPTELDLAYRFAVAAHWARDRNIQCRMTHVERVRARDGALWICDLFGGCVVPTGDAANDGGAL